MGLKFYLGFDSPSRSKGVEVPVMYSCRSMLKRKKPIPQTDWIMDSAGFTELSLNGKYTITETAYLECIERLNPSFAFCQDWMCEDSVLEKTGKTIKEHQELTVLSYLSLNKDKRILPVLQGYYPDDYVQHGEMYRTAGVELSGIWGVGSICKRSSTVGVYTVIKAIKDAFPNMELHAFGLKTTAFKNPNLVRLLYSSDSMAWSYEARMNGPCGSCRNCHKYALEWRKRILSIINESQQQPTQGELI